MSLFTRLLIVITLILSVTIGHAGRCGQRDKNDHSNVPCYKDKCCQSMGGISYCDSSAGRFVCGNGSYSSCYCTRHAVMDLEHIQGCCLWQGGVMDIDDKGLVICNNGGVSETCSLETPPQSIASW